MPGKFEMKKSSDGYFYFNLKSSNGEIILKSERYKAKSGVENGMKSIKTNAPNDASYGRLTSANGKAYFVLKASNGEIIGTARYTHQNQRETTGLSR